MSERTYLPALSNLKTLNNLKKFNIKLSLSEIVNHDTQAAYVNVIVKALSFLRNGVEHLKIELSDYTLDEDPEVDKEGEIMRSILRLESLKTLDIKMPIKIELKQEERVTPLTNLKSLTLKETQGLSETLIRNCFGELESLVYNPGQMSDISETSGLIRAFKTLKKLQKLEFMMAIKEKTMLAGDMFEEIKETLYGLNRLSILHFALSNCTLSENQAAQTLAMLRWKKSLRASWIKLGQYSFHRGPYDLSGIYYF